MNYKIIVPLTERNLLFFPVVVEYLKKNLQARDIVIIGSRSLQDKCKNLDCSFLPEDDLFNDLNYSVIRMLIEKKDSFAVNRTGWYFQQFIKMSYSFICEDDYYLIWDADTIPVTKIDMFNENEIPYFDIKSEYHLPYFTLINKLFNHKIKKSGDYSFISEHMIINAAYMRQMIREIEENDNLSGKMYFEKIINAILKVDLTHSGFSEFETYGNYVMKQYPTAYELRTINSLRDGDRFVDKLNIKESLRELSAHYQIVTVENRLN